MSETGGELTQNSGLETNEQYDTVDELNLGYLKRGDKFIVTAGRFPEQVKSVYTVNVNGLRKDGLLVTVKKETIRGERVTNEDFTARLVGERFKTEAVDPTAGMDFKSLKFLSSDQGLLRSGGEQVSQIQSIQLRRGQ